jgi:hypothetical protein
MIIMRSRKNILKKGSSVNKKYIQTILVIALACSMPTAIFARLYKLKNNSKTQIKYAKCDANEVDYDATAKADKAAADKGKTVILKSGQQMPLESLSVGETTKLLLDSDDSYCLRGAGMGSSYVSYYYNIPIDEKLNQDDPRGLRKEMPILVVRAPGWTENPTGWGFDLEWDVNPWKNELLKNIISGHTRAFGQGVLLKGGLDTSVWNKAIISLKGFVEENGNASLMDDYSKIKQANSDLLFALSQKNEVQSRIGLLDQTIRNMKMLQNHIKSSQYDTPGQKDAKELLIHTALSIETTAEKAKKELM